MINVEINSNIMITYNGINHTNIRLYLFREIIFAV